MKGLQYLYESADNAYNLTESLYLANSYRVL